MRWFGWVLLVLMAVGWLACEIPFSAGPVASQRQLDCWRRTRHGWEQADWLVPPIPARRPALHPGVVGLLELLVSLTALVAFPAHVAWNRASRHRVPPSGWHGTTPPGDETPIVNPGRPASPEPNQRVVAGHSVPF